MEIVFECNVRRRWHRSADGLRALNCAYFDMADGDVNFWWLTLAGVDFGYCSGQLSSALFSLFCVGCVARRVLTNLE